ncbi:MAG: hypothetical protein V7641_2032 [Blastocatellia bacterium]
MATDILWLSPTDFVTGDKSLKISYPSVTHPAVLVKAKTPGDLKWIYLGLRVPLYHDIQAIHVCYQLSNRRSFISQVRLVEMQTPDQAVVRHDDATDLLSTTATSYRSPLVRAFRPGAAVSLALRLNFGSVADTITLGAIGMEVLTHRLESVIRPEDFGAVGDGETDDGPAIQAALVASWAAKIPLHLYAKTYATAQEIDIPATKHTTIIGTRAVDGKVSTFKAIGGMRPAPIPPMPIPPMRAVLSIATDGANVAIENLGIDGNQRALVGIYGQSCSLGTFRSVGVGNCLRDGICFVGEDDREHYTSGSLTLEMLRYLRCDNTWVKASMHRPQLGVTCSVLANGVITFQGAIKLDTLGLQVDPNPPANIIIKKGKEIARCRLISVDSERQITVAPAPAFINEVGCDFSLSNFHHSINDTNSFFDCGGGSNGHVWDSLGADNFRVSTIQHTPMNGSSVEVDIGSEVFTFSGGGIDLYEMQLRQGDGIRIGTSPWQATTDYAVGVRRTNSGNIYRVITQGKSAESGGPTGTGSDITDGTAHPVHWEYLRPATAIQHGMIVSIISPTRLEATFQSAYTGTDLDFEIASGDGYHECPSGDNNINSFQGTSLWRGNANCHFAFSGLYGPLLVGQQMDYAGMYSIRVGQGGPVLTPLFLRNYSEDSGSGKMFFLWSTLGCAIHNPVDQAGKPDDNIDYPGDRGGGSVTGVYYGRNGIFELGHGGDYSTNLHATNIGLNPTVYGLMLLSGGQLEPDSRVTGAPFSINGTTTFSQHCNVLHPYDRDYTLTGKPTFALAARGTLILLSIDQNATGRVTLQDDRFLDGTRQGTKLRLSSNRVTLGPGHSMLLYCDGISWYEIGRTPPVNQTQCVASGGQIGGAVFWAGQILAAVYDAVPTGPRKARNAALAAANGVGTLTNPIGASPGIVYIPGSHFDVQSSGEMHVPDNVWAGGVPAVTDVGTPVYLSEMAGAWTMTAPTSSGSTVVRMGTITVGGAGLVMVLIKIGDPRVNP